MLITAVAFDYDGTLARDGHVDAATTEMLLRLKARGVTLLLVTGRELGELRQIYPHGDAFDLLVAENGALLYRPATHELRRLAPAPPESLLRALERAGLQPLSVGSTIIATLRPSESKLRAAIAEAGVAWRVVANKDAVMALPEGVSKASGLTAALETLQISPLNVLAIGDAENDLALFTASGYRAAVANAVDALQRAADVVAPLSHGAGVRHLIERLLQNPYALTAPVRRHDLPIGRSESDRGIVPTLRADAPTLIAGCSSSGASSEELSWLATQWMECIIASGAQPCMVDPEGRSTCLEPITRLGDAHRAPDAEEAWRLLQSPHNGVMLNLSAIDVGSRPSFFADFGIMLTELRSRLGRPHWLVVGEAHQLLPAVPQTQRPASSLLPGSVWLSSQMQSLAPAWLSSMCCVVAVGPSAAQGLRCYCELLQLSTPSIVRTVPASVRAPPALLWDRAASAAHEILLADRP